MNDYHIHSTFSPDSNQTLEEICEVAIRNGIKEIAITDHFDKKPGFIIEYNNYSNELEKIKNKYKDKLSVLTGIEIGIRPDIIEKLTEYVHQYQFDFIIASTHYVNNFHLDSDDLRWGKTQSEVFSEYLNNLLYIVKNFKNYSIVGHLDLIVRYRNPQGNRLLVSEYGDIIDQILNIIIEDGKGIEINTSSYRCGLNDAMPAFEIIKRYKELGGQIITVGSDAHKSQDIGYKLKETYEMLRNVGFKYVTRFHNRKPSFERL